jgi:hypothetical protein
MAKKLSAALKRGRPVTVGATVFVGLRLPAPLVEAVDKWASIKRDTRSGAIRDLVELGLKRGKTR